jgi:hypothetical protein
MKKKKEGWMWTSLGVYIDFQAAVKGACETVNEQGPTYQLRDEVTSISHRNHLFLEHCFETPHGTCVSGSPQHNRLNLKPGTTLTFTNQQMPLSGVGPSSTIEAFLYPGTLRLSKTRRDGT